VLWPKFGSFILTIFVFYYSIKYVFPDLPWWWLICSSG